VIKSGNIKQLEIALGIVEIGHVLPRTIGFEKVGLQSSSGQGEVLFWELISLINTGGQQMSDNLLTFITFLN